MVRRGGPGSFLARTYFSGLAAILVPRGPLRKAMMRPLSETKREPFLEPHSKPYIKGMHEAHELLASLYKDVQNIEFEEIVPEFYFETLRGEFKYSKGRCPVSLILAEDD